MFSAMASGAMLSADISYGLSTSQRIVGINLAQRAKQ
jgi:hypothetical protein